MIPGTLSRTNPQGVRYGWDSDPEVSLANEEGFPAVPFRFEALEDLTYDTWKDQLVGSARLPSEDANNDSTSNLMLYASTNKRPSITSQSSDSNLITFHHRATTKDVTVSLEQSSDLTSWDETWSSEQPESSGLPWTKKQAWGTTMTDRHEITLPTDAETASYYRVRYRLLLGD